MSDTIIKVENLSKQYHLGTIGTGTLRSDFQRFWANLRGKEDPTLKIGQENSLTNNQQLATNNDWIWALRDINFEVKQGEVLGIIGKNGAGKSTLLKILSKVTTPTTGKVKIRGRIASLLEVGTGFHPELTGRENIFLNGAILGMTKTEVRSKFDEIVDFSGVAKYIDTPVKRYSSGMYVRLAFAIAAHLDPEILIVDEVLAVGDAEFQKKAMGKMQDISEGQGRTVLFVSHNLTTVKNLCHNCMLLTNGKVNIYDETVNVINNYLNLKNDLKLKLTCDKESSIGNEYIDILNATIASPHEKIYREDELLFEFIFKNKIQTNVHVTFVLRSIDDTVIFQSMTKKSYLNYGKYKSCFYIPPYILNNETYKIQIVFIQNDSLLIYHKEDILVFQVENINQDSIPKIHGLIRPQFKTELTPID